MWPSAVALSRWLVTNPHHIIGKDVLELGAGCGLVGLVVASMNASRSGNDELSLPTSSVTMTDFNEMVVKNIDQNIRLNGVELFATASGLDFYKQDPHNDGWIDESGTTQKQVDVVLASDIICQPSDAFAAARSISCALRHGGKAFIISADSKHRFGVEKFEEACLEVGLKLACRDVKDICNGRLLYSDMEKTPGYVDGMKLTMFTIEKI